MIVEISRFQPLCAIFADSRAAEILRFEEMMWPHPPHASFAVEACFTPRGLGRVRRPSSAAPQVPTGTIYLAAKGRDGPDAAAGRDGGSWAGRAPC